MIRRSPAEVMALPHSQKELTARNRNKSGYAVYMSWFYHDFYAVSTEVRRDILSVRQIHDDRQYDDDDSCVSDPPITSGHSMRLCGMLWREQSHDQVVAWKDRATNVNQLPILGAFTSLPETLQPNTEQMVMKSLTLEYDRLRTYIHNGLKKTQPFTDSVKEKTFGRERFELGTQLFRSFFLNYLLKLTFFGSNCSKLSPHEVVYRTNKSVVVHIASHDRMIELFTMNGVCAFEYKKDGDNDGETHRYTCGGKVIVKEKRGRMRECVGYVMSERRNDIDIRLENGEEIIMVRPDINELGIWSYHNQHNDDCEYRIVEYWPIRLKLLNSGFTHMTINKFVLSADNDLIIN